MRALGTSEVGMNPALLIPCVNGSRQRDRNCNVMGQGLRLFLLLVSVMWLTGAQAFAQSSSADALFNTGKSYHDGVGVTQNYDVARAYYERAAAAGSTDAYLNLGYLYFVGEGVPRNFVTARRWYERAAKAGDASAVKNLDFMNAQELGVPKKRVVKPRKAKSETEPKTAPKIIETPLEPVGANLALVPETYLLTSDVFEARAVKSLGPFYVHPSKIEGVNINVDPPISLPSNTQVAQVVLTDVSSTTTVSIVSSGQSVSATAIAPTREQTLTRLRTGALGLPRNTDVAALGGLVFILTLISLILLSDFYVKNRKRASFDLAVEFFEENRRTVRDAYFRYSAELRDMRYAESKLDTVLSVLIVRYVLSTDDVDCAGPPRKQGRLVEKIRSLARTHPAKSRHLAGSLAPHILGLIRSDIRALDKEHETAPTAPDFYKAPEITPPKHIWKPRIVKAN